MLRTPLDAAARVGCLAPLLLLLGFIPLVPGLHYVLIVKVEHPLAVSAPAASNPQRVADERLQSAASRF